MFIWLNDFILNIFGFSLTNFLLLVIAVEILVIFIKLKKKGKIK